MAKNTSTSGTKKCRFCKTEIDSTATICPTCNKSQKKKFPIWVVIIVVLLLCGITSASMGGSDTDTSSGSSENKPEATESISKKFDIDEIYSKIKNGMTEDEVNKIITKEPLNCTESEIQGLGTSKLCTYGNVFLDSGAIMVTYSNGKVISKTKSQY